ncbi:MAG: M6 family metalloprotease domain-containing protein [Prevotella sp.]|nr:M6 family metalloprotease domain-containing protein [Prevotella sp.]
MKTKRTNHQGAKWVSTFALMALFTLSSTAQTKFHRYNCMAPGEQEQSEGAMSRVSQRHRLPTFKPDMWTYNQDKHSIVVLVEFTDRAFSMENPRERYDSIFNCPGYNEGRGPGCVADYFREQSGGLCDITFDVYGPVKVSTSEKSNGTYGSSALREALKHVVDSLNVSATQTDTPPMGTGTDWTGNGYATQVVFVFAGYGGNENAEICKKSIWPNTSSFSALTLPSGVKANVYTASAELWSTGKLCGIGTICHEFSHSLGLPDIYPTSKNATEYSVVDEWDLMDGGNFTNNGWCPCNYTALEKMLLGWKTPIELDSATTVLDMKPISEGGETYLVRNTNNEYYLLENRQWSGWDLRLPGHGLLISHVDYNASKWSGNTVNNDPSHHRFDLVHADNMDYTGWDNYIYAHPEIYKGGNPYISGHNHHLSNTPYPYTTEDGTVKRELTDESVPAATMFNPNGDGIKLMSKPITDITETDDGLVSFRFCQLKGDVNYDGVVDVADYVAIAHHILGNTPEMFDPLGADVNGDGVINVADYTAVVHIILEGSEE